MLLDATYPPLDTLKPVAKDVWVVDGPAIKFGPPLLRMSFPTRMTILRLAGGSLFVHSPTPLTQRLRAEVESLGVPRWIIGPSRIHYWWIPEWRDVYPDAQVYLAPRIREQAGARITFAGLPLDRDSGYPWDEAIATLPIAGRYLTEVEFFHRPSRTLILTDLIENFEPRKLGAGWRWLARLGGVLDPNGGTPRDLRLTFAKSELRDAVLKMIAWDPERIILAHGRWYARDGARELRRAFGWLLD
jgi:hypothetical protein